MRSELYLLSNVIPVTSILIGMYIVTTLFGTNNQDFENNIILDFTTISIIIVMLIISSVVFIIIFTKLKSNKIRIIYGFILSSSVIELVSEMILIIDFDNPSKAYLILLQIILFTIFMIYFLYVYAMGKPQTTTRNIGILVTSVIIGRQLSIMLDVETVIFVIIILSIYDVYSVFKGPLSRVLGKPKSSKYIIPTSQQVKRQIEIICEKGTPVYISKYSLLGIGDTLFFAMVLELSLRNWGLGAMMFTYFAIIIGTVMTLLVLRKISPLPALPAPMFLSLIIILKYNYLL